MVNSFKPFVLTVSQVLLWPFAVLYKSITRFRNYLYDTNYKKTLDFTPFIISVGNLSVGGTGKSPMIEFLTDWLLRESYAVAILSRGYGRKTRGVRLATGEDSAETLGDEPYQFYRKYQQQPAVVAVAEERVLGVPEIMHHHPETEIVLLDDAYQHRSIARNLNLLLTSFDRPFYHDRVLPAGRLREGRSGAKRADAVIVTKCPNELSSTQRDEVTTQISRYTQPNTPIFFSGIRYADPQPVFEGSEMKEKVIAFSGIARPKLFQQYVQHHFLTQEYITFADHHRYTEKDIENLRKRAQAQNVCFMTTEKDMVKMISGSLTQQWQQLPLFYIPIQTHFLPDNTTFTDWLRQQIPTPAVS
ncbi:tetraacyldisaccharide 4'-kinase [Tunicatimonas pelagia]|uniref:tetraacyldisaccharide 4'-kinase n=1 Tax=Tunicatimonas pelagia TaxID=931531 RepID=UPI002666D978|nr:tetraacyldisaccharide 4'-kinase [Tunicatimonas pelagia]WKN41486.1 tetraacyldisaccharide 4'-kinase [Tunicatimonas pelagia]